MGCGSVTTQSPNPPQQSTNNVPSSPPKAASPAKNQPQKKVEQTINNSKAGSPTRNSTFKANNKA